MTSNENDDLMKKMSYSFPTSQLMKLSLNDEHTTGEGLLGQEKVLDVNYFLSLQFIRNWVKNAFIIFKDLKKYRIDGIPLSQLLMVGNTEYDLKYF